MSINLVLTFYYPRNNFLRGRSYRWAQSRTVVSLCSGIQISPSGRSYRWVKLNPSIALFWHSIALENPTFVIQAFKALLGKSNIGHSFKIKAAPRLEALRKPPSDILVSKIGGLAHSIHCDKLFIIIRDCSQKMESNDYLKSLPTCDR